MLFNLASIYPSNAINPGMQRKKIIGPYSFSKTTENGEKTKTILCYNSEPKLLHWTGYPSFEQDEEPQNWAIDVQRFWIQTFCGAVLGRRV